VSVLGVIKIPYRPIRRL